jgi:hypothetical protein
MLKIPMIKENIETYTTISNYKVDTGTLTTAQIFQHAADFMRDPPLPNIQRMATIQPNPNLSAFTRVSPEDDSSLAVHTDLNGFKEIINKGLCMGAWIIFDTIRRTMPKEYVRRIESEEIGYKLVLGQLKKGNDNHILLESAHWQNFRKSRTVWLNNDYTNSLKK